MKWSGPNEKKWEWYKHTKPCYNLIYMGSCKDTNCNYAHTLDQYIDAILKRKFKIDFNVVNQLKKIDNNSSIMKMIEGDDAVNGVDNQPSAKRRRID